MANILRYFNPVFFVLFALMASLVNAQSRGDTNEENIKTLEACRTLIGSTYWYRPDRGTQSIFIRASSSGDLPSRSYWSYLSLADDTSFVVNDCKTNEINSFTLFKIAFPDGAIGFLETLNFSSRHSDKNSVMSYLYPGLAKARGTQNYVYPSPPQQILDVEIRVAQELAQANAARADADWKAREARGGIRIGMTMKKVRDSTWGDPEKINRTITINGTTEQWVYSNGYLYFKNGILTTIQN